MSNLWASLSLGPFPSTDHLVRGSWAPLYFEPIPGSGERLTIAIAVVGQTGFEVVAASRLSALGCLFPNDVDRLEFFVRAAIEAVTADVKLRGMEALTSPNSPMGGVYLGKPQESLGDSLKSIAESWLRKSSSLASHGEEQFEEQSLHNEAPVAPPRRLRTLDNLPLVIYDGVVEKMPLLSAYFRDDIRERRTRRRGYPNGIDYCGRKIVANFCTLHAARISVTRVNQTLKPPLWDLRSYRDKHPMYNQASFELHVQRPAAYDTQFTDNEHRKVAQVLANLELEADLAEIILRPYSTAEEIIGRIIEAEAA